MELLILAFVACPIVAIALSFAFSADADSSMGDGMILGVLVLAVPLWPISMPMWILYLLVRHRNAVAEGGSMFKDAVDGSVPCRVGRGHQVDAIRSE